MQDVHQLLDALGVQWRDAGGATGGGGGAAGGGGGGELGAGLPPLQLLQQLLLPALRLLLRAMHQVEPLVENPVHPV